MPWAGITRSLDVDELTRSFDVDELSPCSLTIDELSHNYIDAWAISKLLPHYRWAVCCNCMQSKYKCLCGNLISRWIGSTDLRSLAVCYRKLCKTVFFSVVGYSLSYLFIVFTTTLSCRIRIRPELRRYFQKLECFIIIIICRCLEMNYLLSK